MFIRHLIGGSTLMVLTVLPAVAQNVVYLDDFSGAVGTPLHGLAPDTNNSGVDGATWVTRTDTGLPDGVGQIFFADGTIDASLGGTSGSATLPFTPMAGLVYTLTASFDTVVSTAQNWVALGFTAGQSSVGGNNDGRFISGATAGQPWMIYRGTGATDVDQAFIGPGTTGGIGWATPVTASRGAPADLRIVLDTSTAMWNAQWQAKNPTDGAFTTIRSETFATNPTIGGVGIAVANIDIMSSISSFRLETSGTALTPGDVNGDGQVNLDDFIVISDNLFNSPANRAQGDLDGNSVVDFLDFHLWKSLAGAAGAGVTLGGVPEPASWLLTAMGISYLAFRRRRGLQ